MLYHHKAYIFIHFSWLIGGNKLEKPVIYAKNITSKHNKYTIITDIKKNPVSYLMGLPVIFYTFIFGYLTYPFITIAFQKYTYNKDSILKALFLSPFVGLKNFEFFFKSTQVWNVTRNTFLLNFMFLLFGTITAVAIALLLNEIRGRVFKRTVQSFMLFPNYLSWVVVSFMIYSIFTTEYGLLNNILTILGKSKVAWYNEARYWPVILTIMNVWKGAGMTAVIYLASIAGIDETYYEAAALDGASRLRMCWHITLPLLIPTVAILTLLSIGRIMYGDFGMFYAIIGDNGILLSTTDIIETYVFRALRRIGDPSNAMAVSLFQAIIGFVMVFGSNAIVRRYDQDAALF